MRPIYVRLREIKGSSIKYVMIRGWGVRVRVTERDIGVGVSWPSLRLLLKAFSCSSSCRYQTDNIGCYAFFGVHFEFERNMNANSTMHR